VTAEQLAQLAQSLKDNEAFQMVLENQRKSALERLATMPHSDEQAFYAAQAIVAVIDGINSDLGQFIRAGTPKAPPGIA
jgi:hypothetical protein